MKKVVVCLLVLAVAGAASAAVNVPAGLTGLWQFATSANKMHATIGTDMTSSHVDNSYWYPSPTTHIGTETQPELYSDSGCVQERSWDYLTCTHGISANGGGEYVNSYTIAMDYVQTNLAALWEGNYYNSLYQTAGDAHGNDGDLFVKAPALASSVIGNGDVGYSTLTFDASVPNRIVLSVDNANFFRVYVNGVLFLDGEAQGVDGRFSLNPTVYLFADNDWEDAWGLVGTVAVWDHALTTAEVAGMGGCATPLVIPEPATMTVLALGGLLLRRKK